jgi:hypothetical protein
VDPSFLVVVDWKNMKKIILIGLILWGLVYWTEFSNFVVGNATVATESITKWLVEHTPRK